VTSERGAKTKRNQNGNLERGGKTKTSLPGSPPPAPYEVRWWGTREGGKQKQIHKKERKKKKRKKRERRGRE